jgi:PAS domain-containing protein
MKRYVLLLSSFFILVPGFALTAEFDPDYIISDDEINDVDAMTIGEIDSFLRSKNSSLSYIYPEDYDGITRTVPEIIWLASQRYQINPKYTLTLLQKEQSLIENPSPSNRDLDWATGYAVCDSCTTIDPAIQKYRGFGKQVDNGVGFMRFFQENPEKTSPFLVGVPVTVTDYFKGSSKSYTIIPVNQSTASLYKYTPHYSGNLSFWKIWQKYFSQEYTNGTLVKISNENNVWLIQDGKKRPFTSFGILVSRYNPDKIVTITKADLDTFDEGSPISFPQYSYLRAPSGTVFLIIDDARFGFASSEALRILGINPEEIVDVTWEDLLPYDEGKSITVESAYPTGALLQNNTTGGVFYVLNGEKFPIWSREILVSRFPKTRITSVHPGELESYATGSPIHFLDGELIRNNTDPTVYIIENGLRRPITSSEHFLELGYSWDNVIITSESAVNLHLLGTPVS